MTLQGTLVPGKEGFVASPDGEHRGVLFRADDAFPLSPAGNLMVPWVFLETNPNGEWEWLEGDAGAPITAAIADELEGR